MGFAFAAGSKSLTLADFWPPATALLVMALRIVLDMTVWNESGTEALTRFKRTGVDFAFAGFSLLAIALTRTNSTFHEVFPPPGNGAAYLVTIVVALILCIITIAVFNIEHRRMQRSRGWGRIGEVVARILLIGAVWTIGVFVFFVAATLV